MYTRSRRTDLALEEELELEVIEKDQGEKPEADYKTMLFPKANEWFAGKRCLEREEIRRITKFREGSVPSLAEVAFHLVGLSLFSRDYAWFVFYLQASSICTAEQRAHWHLSHYMLTFPVLKKNLKDQLFLQN